MSHTEVIVQFGTLGFLPRVVRFPEEEFLGSVLLELVVDRLLRTVQQSGGRLEWRDEPHVSKIWNPRGTVESLVDKNALVDGLGNRYTSLTGKMQID